jgi:glycosyltransferase involved in cell wall biosynthesis
MEQRKILILTNRVPYPLKDGGNLAMKAMIEGYRRVGWKVYLLAMNTSKHYVEESQVKKLFTNLYAFEWVDINNDLNWKDIAWNYFFSKEPEHAIRFYSKVFEQKMIAVLKSFKPDVVQMESVYLTTYLPQVKEHSYAVSVLRMHNVEYQIWQGLANKQHNRIKKIYLATLTERIRNFERDAWKKYDLLLAITEKDAYLVNRLEQVNNIIIAPFSVEMDTIKPGKSERWVGYHIGAMDWIPNKEGIEWFLDQAWPKIHKAAPQFEFYYAGRKMPQKFKDLDMPGVFCMDEVHSAEEFIEDKKILIVPIWSSGGIRVKILEAMAAGKIVITTSSGIKGIDAKPDEHFLLARKPEEFAKAVKWCLENKEDAVKLGVNAINLVKEKYEYTKVISEVINEIETILTASGEE